MGKGRARPVIVGFAVVLFSSNLLLGTLLGSAARTRYEEYLASAVVQNFKADQEFLVRLHCKGLGLISDVPRPCALGSDQEKPKSPEKPSGTPPSHHQFKSKVGCFSAAASARKSADPRGSHGYFRRTRPDGDPRGNGAASP
jgi:hypothetical protein